MFLCACCSPLLLVLLVPFKTPDYQVSLKVICRAAFDLQMSQLTLRKIASMEQ